METFRKMECGPRFNSGFIISVISVVVIVVVISVAASLSNVCAQTVAFPRIHRHTIRLISVIFWSNKKIANKNEIFRRDYICVIALK